MKRNIRKATPDRPHREYWTAEGYYATVKEALVGLVNHKVRATELKDIETVVAKIDKLYKLINGLEVK